MKFSIVIPLFNKAEFICETLQSLVNQTKLPYEIVLVDDASTDESLEKVKDFISDTPIFENILIKIIELKENKGPGNARNIGFSKTKGDLVSFLDADDIYSPDLIRTADEIILSYQIDFLVLGIKMFPSGKERPPLNYIKQFLSPISSEAFLINNPLKAATNPDFVMGVGSNIIVKRKWLESTKYSENVYLFEGIDYWYRVLKFILGDKNTNIGLLMGNYLQVREVPLSLSRRKYDTWNEIDFPPILKRYRKSKDIYDKLLMGVISKRWILNGLKNLTSNKQKLLFVLKYRSLFLKQIYYFFLRKIRFD